MDKTLTTTRYAFELVRLPFGEQKTPQALGKVLLRSTELGALVLSARGGYFRQVEDTLGITRGQSARNGMLLYRKLATVGITTECAKNNAAEAVERAAQSVVVFPAISDVWSPRELLDNTQKLGQIIKAPLSGAFASVTRVMVVRQVMSGFEYAQIAEQFNNPELTQKTFSPSIVQALGAAGSLGAMTRGKALAHMQHFCAKQNLDRRQEYFHRMGARLGLCPRYAAKLLEVIRPGQPNPAWAPQISITFPSSRCRSRTSKSLEPIGC